LKHTGNSPISRKPDPDHGGAGPRGAAREDAARELAVVALSYIASNPEELSRFLALTGIDPAAIRAAAEEPGFLTGVLDYICGNERTLVAFAAHADVAPEAIEAARQLLAGANWERDVP
jgi:uncharacterized protein DUF3572